jgi:hypothetical protein
MSLGLLGDRCRAFAGYARRVHRARFCCRFHRIKYPASPG